MTDDRPQGQVELDELDAAFSALSHQARRAILSVLHAHGAEMSSKDIADRFSIAWPTTTRHLRVLEDAGLIESVRRGSRAHYRLNVGHLAAMVGGWLRRFGDF